MKLSLPSFARWRSGALAAFNRFPWNILCGVTGAVCLIVLIHTEHNPWLEGQCERLAMAAAVGMPLFFSLRMVRESAESLKRWPIEAFGVVLLALWVIAQPPRPSDAPGIIWIRWLLLIAALHFLVAVSPYLRRTGQAGFWQFNRRLFLRFCLATLYTVVLTSGLELALLSADKLFELKFNNAYGDLFFIMVGVFHPAFFLAGVPTDFQALNEDTEYPRGLKAFTQFALAPLVAVYTAILYAYTIKIIIARSWPHGWVALPVLLLSGIGIFAFLLLYPLRTRDEEKWAQWFTTNLPRSLAPLTLLLLLSLRVRISEYGVTESRYLGVVLGFWVLVWALVFVLRKQTGIRWVPSSLSVIFLLTAFGPWSAGAISKQGQLTKLQRFLQAKGLWSDGHAQPADHVIQLPPEEVNDLRSTLSYLVSRHGAASIQQIFAPVMKQTDWTRFTGWQAASELLTALNTSAQDYAVRFGNRSSEESVNIQGYRRLWRAEQFGGEQKSWAPQNFDDVSIGLDFGVLKLATNQDNTPKPVPLDSLFSSDSFSSTGDLVNKNLTVDFQHGDRSFRIVFTNIHFRNTAQGARLTGYQLYLLEK